MAMFVYWMGSKCGRYVKVGKSKRSSMTDRFDDYEKNAHRFIEWPFRLCYFRTDTSAEQKLKEHFRPNCVDVDKHGKEVFHVEPVIGYIAWLRMQWFTELDLTGANMPEVVDYAEAAPSTERVSRDFRARDMFTDVIEEKDPFWYLPDTKVESNEDFITPEILIEPVRRALGGAIELDPASHPAANKVVKAQRIYTKSMDGLDRDWSAESVWLSPHKEDMGSWAAKAFEEIRSGRARSLVCLIGTRSASSKYFRKLLARATGICMVEGAGPTFGGRGALTENNSPDRWHLVYYGPDVDLFADSVGHLGECFNGRNPLIK